MKVIDQMGRELYFSAPPKRIISLVPSISEFIIDIGLVDRLVGITKFCVHPKEVTDLKTKVGGTKKLNLSKIRLLKPDLIIGNKEENVKEQIEELASEFPVWMSDCNTFNEALDMMRVLGEITHRKIEVEQLIFDIESSFSNLNIGQGKSFLYFIWNDPMYLAGRGTFINSMLEKIGFNNACEEERYPEWKAQLPDVVFLSSEPFPFKESHFDQFSRLFPTAKIKLVDGEMCSWYGSRMLKAVIYFRNFMP
jgi:ABC-type Fe3+-hydroxamate transport system substrate-binding protein